MPNEPRSYRQFCGVAKALDVLGGRWTLLIVRDLLIGPRRFVDLMKGLPGITTNLLTGRLRDMQAAELIEKRRLPAPSASVVYELTASGRELEPLVMALGAWGGRFMTRPARGDTLDIGWAMLSMKRRFTKVTKPYVIELRVDTRVFQYRIDRSGVNVREGADRHADCVVSARADAVRELFFRGASASALASKKHVTIEGRGAAWAAFLGAFGLNA